MIMVESDIGGDTVTIYANSAKLKLSIGAVYALRSHLNYTLEQMEQDQVTQDRRHFVEETYRAHDIR